MFRPIIFDNYYTLRHFYFELDHTQTENLLSLFTRMRVKDNARSPFFTSKGKNVCVALPKTRKGTGGLDEIRIPGEHEDKGTEFGGERKSAVVSRRENSYASILDESGGTGLFSLSGTSHSLSEETEQKEFIPDQEELGYDVMKAAVPSSSGHGLSKEGGASTADLLVNDYGLSTEERVLLRLKKLALEQYSLNQSSKSAANEGAAPCMSEAPAENNKQIPEGPSSSQDITETTESFPDSGEVIKIAQYSRISSLLSSVSFFRWSDNLFVFL